MLFRRRKLLRFLPPGLLTLLPAVLVLSSAGRDFTLLGSDMVVGSYHIRGLVGRLLREGHLPVWDPHTMCGFPLLAAMQAGVLYPLTWPAAFLSPGPFWTATVLVHLILAGLFAFAWLKKGLRVGTAAGLIGACVFMLSGYVLTRVLGGHISQICAYPWLAAVLWRTERLLHRPTVLRWILLAASVALLILPGFPQFAFFAAVILLVRLVAYRVRAGAAGTRTMLLAAAAGGAGALFCAPQFLATLEMVPEVQRVAGASYEFATQQSVPWHNLLCYLAPSFFGDDVGTPYWSRGAIWETTAFVGITGLILAALALRGSHPQRRFWAAAAGIAVLVALGKEAPFFKVVYYSIPGASLFRQPGRYLAVLTLAMSALSALGFDRLWKAGPDLRRSTRVAAIGVAAILGAILLTLAVWNDPAPWSRFVTAQFADGDNLVSESVRNDPAFPEQARRHARAALVGAAVTLAVLSACLFGYSPDRRRARLSATALGVLLAAELTVFGHGFLKSYESRLIAWPSDFVDFVKNRPGGPYLHIAEKFGAKWVLPKPFSVKQLDDVIRAATAEEAPAA